MTIDQYATTPPDDSDPLDAVPKLIARFRIERILGKGGFGVVYLGYDEQLERRVAIKVPKPEFIERPEDRELYLKEARMVAGFEHPNIVPVLDVGSTTEFPIYIVSKFIDGKDLAKQLSSALPSHQLAVQWMIDLADAFREAHRKGFVHRDVKPQNILVDRNDRVYLVDFGLALRDEDVGKSLPAGGTPIYMSPEQARGEGHRVDGRSDLFSLGVVFYEMLVGRRPFHGSTKLELFDQITGLDPKPLRQWDDSIAPELERICFKMLAKRKSERYSSASDLATDLKVFLDKSLAEIDSTDSVRIVEGAQAKALSPTKAQAALDTPRQSCDTTPNAPTPTSGSDTLKIVPKGLRSFDHRDADFFLELLPGPRDREGLPESVGFWKSRIEERDADQTFSVGLVYGPSGCGKSSMMKAGLLPKLAPDIVSIYLEATSDDTERTLLAMIGKKLDSVKSESVARLVDLLQEIRRGRILARGKKLVIVIDQFEQWLFAHPQAAGQPLWESLLQCDGSRVQAIVMVRDDFWMAAMRFFRDLDIPLVERHNSAAVDLFDLDHAQRVLKAFGRAFGKLDASGKEDKQDNKQFISDAVLGLSEQGKVISVRLSLFAEMMKSRPWTPESLRTVGGTTGVGATFLEETFSASGAPPQHRYHQAAARSVLRALLPEAGKDIKGHKKPIGELRTACQYGDRQRDFDDLIRILDSELRLITPVDTEVESLSDSAADSKLAVRNYQLTHDYLVPSLRDWLTRKQRETRRGRAELKLAERSAAWSSKREAKQLPTLTEWLGIAWLTDRKQWTETQRSMMRAARNTHATTWGIALVTLLLVSLGIQQWVVAQRWASLKAQTQVAVDAAQNNRGASVEFTTRDLQKLPRSLVLPELESRFQGEKDPQRKIGLAFALARYESWQTKFLVDQIDVIGEEDTFNLIISLELDRENAIKALQQAADGCEKTQWRRKAKLATASAYLGESAIAVDMCAFENRPDPEQRTLFIDEFPKWHGNLQRVMEATTAVDSPALRSGICFSAGQIPFNRLSSDERKSFQTSILQWYKDKADTSTHSASGWLLRQWGITPPELVEATKIVTERRWFVNSVGMTMLNMPRGRFHLLAESNEDSEERDVEIKHDFWLADREVSVGQFQLFIDDKNCPDADKPDNWEGADADVSPSPEHPAQQVNWYDAIMYCNWLSRREGLAPSYQRTDSEVEPWKPLPGASGYRLPLEFEWEYACRAGTTTDFACGTDEGQLRAYAQCFPARRTLECGRNLANAWGLFDMHGNVSEWCEHTVSGSPYVIRGGSFNNRAAECRVAIRLRFVPKWSTATQGFRLALSSPSVQPSEAAEDK